MVIASSARSLMVYRAKVVRESSTGRRTSWGHTEDYRRTISESLPCYVWADDDKLTYGDYKVAVLTAYRMIAPIGADITLGDDVEEIKDKRGRLLFTEAVRMEVMGRTEIPGSHLSLVLNGVR